MAEESEKKPPDRIGSELSVNELLQALRSESARLEGQIQSVVEAELQRYSILCFNAQAVLARLRDLNNPTKEQIEEITDTLWSKLKILDRRGEGTRISFDELDPKSRAIYLQLNS